MGLGSNELFNECGTQKCPSNRVVSNSAVSDCVNYDVHQCLDILSPSSKMPESSSTLLSPEHLLVVIFPFSSFGPRRPTELRREMFGDTSAMRIYTPVRFLPPSMRQCCAITHNVEISRFGRVPRAVYLIGPSPAVAGCNLIQVQFDCYWSTVHLGARTYFRIDHPTSHSPALLHSHVHTCVSTSPSAFILCL